MMFREMRLVLLLTRRLNQKQKQTEHAVGTGGKSRVGSDLLNPFDAVLDQYVVTLFYS